MSKRGLKSDDVEGFVRAFNDEVADTQEAYQVREEFQLCKGKYGSELYIRATAYRKGVDGQECIYAVSETRWPSHVYNSLHAMVYRAAIAMNVAVQYAYRAETGHWHSSQTEEPAK